VTTDTAQPSVAPAQAEALAARLERLLAEHARSLERIAASYARTLAEREDLLQDFAMALWTALPTFRGDASERTFLLRIAHNRAVTFLSRRAPNQASIEDYDESAEASSGKNPALAYERKERGSRLLAAARALPLGHRQVLTLLLEGLSHREIAGVLGVTENNVAVRANRARAALRVLLGDDQQKGKP
jgi:RNA polymerase sigma-70 factor (ECF subfamily)